MNAEAGGDAVIILVFLPVAQGPEMDIDVTELDGLVAITQC
jgi:hypothetical protein